MRGYKDIVGYEGLYAIDKKGNVRAYSSNKLKKQKRKCSCTKKGYMLITLCKNGVVKTHSVHKLVALTYIPNPDNLPTVDHINRNKLDNSVENLRWADYHTQLINRNVDYSKRKRIYKKGSEHQYAKKVYCIETKEIFGSIKEASLKHNVSSVNIIKCCKGERKSAGGYKWEYCKSA